MQELLEWMEYIEDTRQQRKVRHAYLRIVETSAGREKRD